MDIRIGGIASADVERFLLAMATPFGFDLSSDDRESRVAEFRRVFEVDRARCAFDGDEIVGTLGAFTLPMTVPGGARVPVGGTTMVTVLPSHRRRGALRRLIEAHFDEVRERGESMAALWASDSAIYHRFGFGMATVSAQVTIERDHAHFHRLAPETLPVRMVPADDILELVRSPYEVELSRRPGMYARNEAWWERRLRDRESDREGATAFRYAVVERSGTVEGYVQYRIKAGPWSDNHGDGEIRVRELIGTTPEASASLWSFVLGHDLTARITAHNVPEDDPLFSLLDGSRRSAPRIVDQMWLRILDVDAALRARTYASDGSLTMTIHDPSDRTLTTRRLEVVDGRASVGSHVGEADIHLDIEDLSACYLGRSRFRELSRAGRLTGTPEALTLADNMFGWDPAPWCQETF